MRIDNSIKLGFIGLGLMGTPMTLRLLNHGFDVCVWNRSSDKYDVVLKAGAIRADSIQHLVDQCDVILLCLSDIISVGKVVFNEEGVASSGCSEKVLVDFSSSDPVQTRIFANRLKGQCGMQWVDAPVSGGVAGAEKGELIIMAGGSESVLDSLAPIFSPLATRVTRMGDVGAGQTTKLCNQMIVGCNALVIAEMVAMARVAGVDVEKLPEALSGGFADSKPFQILVPQMSAHDFTLKWHVKTVLKDIQNALSFAQEQECATPMLELGTKLMGDHGEQGHMEDDMSTLVGYYEWGHFENFTIDQNTVQ